MSRVWTVYAKDGRPVLSTRSVVRALQRLQSLGKGARIA